MMLYVCIAQNGHSNFCKTLKLLHPSSESLDVALNPYAIGYVLNDFCY